MHDTRYKRALKTFTSALTLRFVSLLHSTIFTHTMTIFITPALLRHHMGRKRVIP